MTDTEPIDVIERYFPYFTPACYQQDQILAAVNDIDAWHDTLYYWAGNGYRPQSVNRMLEYYEERVGKKRQFDNDAMPSITLPEDGLCSSCGREFCLRDHRYDEAIGI